MTDTSTTPVTSPITGFGGEIPNYFHQIQILEKYFEEKYSLNKTQRNIISDNYYKKRMMVLPLFAELRQPQIVLPIRNAISALYHKGKEFDFEVDNNIRSKYEKEFRRVNNGSIIHLWKLQGKPDNLLLIPFEIVVENEFKTIQKNILYKKIYYSNFQNKFWFGVYETLIAKILFGDTDPIENTFPLLCFGDELSEENNKFFHSTPVIESYEKNITINGKSKFDLPYPLIYFRGIQM